MTQNNISHIVRRLTTSLRGRRPEGHEFWAFIRPAKFDRQDVFIVSRISEAPWLVLARRAA